MLNEADTRAKLIDPAIRLRGWTEDQIRREETAGKIEIVAGKGRRRARGRSSFPLDLRPSMVDISLTQKPIRIPNNGALRRVTMPRNSRENAGRRCSEKDF
jgi:type I site-specific restriction endonuclease